MFLLLFFLGLFPCSIAAGTGQDEETPVMFTDMVNELDAEAARPWRPPDYSGQEAALGYEKDLFAVPKSMQERVSFWVDIYTKFSTDEGLLHDSRYVKLVYETVDFRPIMNNKDLSLLQKRRARRKMVNEAKREIRNRLVRLSQLKSADGLSGEDLRYWNMFANIEEKNKFLKAKRRGRLRFQLGQRDRFIKGLYFSGRYLEQMEAIFKEHGLPIELTRMVYVESSFNIKARSKVGASGIWQFMPYTGRQYLKMNGSADERNDPIRATEAAAKKLKANYKLLKKWPLAITGYNHGPAGMRRMVRRYKTDKIEELVDERRGRFGFASANFYASFLAALIVDKDAHKFFGTGLKWAAPLRGEEIRLTKNITHKALLKWFAGDESLARLYNPHLKRNVWRGYRVIKKRNFVRVITEKKDMVLAEMKELEEAPPPLLEGKVYRIASGETLSEVALEFGVSLRELIEINEISNPRRILPGTKLLIPKRR